MVRQTERGLLAAIVVIIALALAYYASSHPMDLRVYHFDARGVYDGTKPVSGPPSGLCWLLHYRYSPLVLLLVARFAAMPLSWAAAVWVLLKVSTLFWLLRSMSLRGLDSGCKWSHGLILAVLFI